MNEKAHIITTKEYTAKLKMIASLRCITMHEVIEKYIDEVYQQEFINKFSETYKGASEEVEMYMEKGEVDGKKGHK